MDKIVKKIASVKMGELVITCQASAIVLQDGWDLYVRISALKVNMEMNVLQSAGVKMVEHVTQPQESAIALLDGRVMSVETVVDLVSGE